MKPRTLGIYFLMVGALVQPCAAGSEWTHAAGDPARTSTALRGPRTLQDLRWQASPLSDEEFVAQSAPVVAGGRVFVNMRVIDGGGLHTGNRLIAYDAADGSRLWATPLDADIVDSWSSPAVDVQNGTVLLGTSRTLYALDQGTGAIAWQTELDRSMVNASALVTAGLSVNGAPANRIFISDFKTGSSTPGSCPNASAACAKLYAINAAPFDAVNNPYVPGERVWTFSLGAAAGATPAFQNGTVYLAFGRNHVLAIDALSPPTDPNDPNRMLPDWQTEVQLSTTSLEAGFFGGVSVSGGALFAATYNFSGGQNSADLFRLDAATGVKQWSTNCERTDALPVPSGAGALYLAGGIVGFGSAIKTQAFADLGTSANLVWETTQAPNLGALGGWTHQPAFARDYLYVGGPDPNAPSGSFGPNRELVILDTSHAPGDPGFVVDRFSGAGGSPALAYGRLFSFGVGGLYAFEPSPECAADISGNGRVDLTDLARLLIAFGTSRGEDAFDVDADIDLDGNVTLTDLALLLLVFGAECE